MELTKCDLCSFESVEEKVFSVLYLYPPIKARKRVKGLGVEWDERERLNEEADFMYYGLRSKHEPKTYFLMHLCPKCTQWFYGVFENKRVRRPKQ